MKAIKDLFEKYEKELERLDNIIECNWITIPKEDLRIILQSIKPIEVIEEEIQLPIYRKIKEKATHIYSESHNSLQRIDAFIKGAEWIKEQNQKQNGKM